MAAIVQQQSLLPMLSLTPTATLQLLVLAFCIHLSCGLVAAPTLAPNPLYSYAGVFTFDTTPFYNLSNNTFNPHTFSLTFPSRPQTSTTYHFGYAIHELNYEFTSQNLNISLWVATKQTTSATAQLFSNNANKISLLKVSYVLIEPLFGLIGFVYVWMTPSVNLINGQFFTQTASGLGPYNLTGNLSFWNTVVGYDFTLQANKEFDFFASVSTINATSILFKIGTISPVSFFVTSMVAGALVYNPAELLAAPRSARFTVGQVTSTSSLSYSTSSIQNYNAIIGVYSHHIVNINNFQERMTISPPTVSAASDYAYSWYAANYLYLQFAYCSAATPYLMPTNGSCLDACPARYFVDSYNECQPCPTYDCYTCLTNGSCSSCSAMLDYREMDNSSLRCLPLAGYVDDGSNSTAVFCGDVIPNCQACAYTPSLTCFTCTAGYFLDASGSTCQACPSTCISCTSASFCLTCIPQYTLIYDLCLTDCSSITNCTSCTVLNSTSIQCDVCAAGYSLVSNSCPSVCGNGYRLASENCDDNNTVNGDGCSSTCTVEPYFYCVDNATFFSSCSPCLANCSLCTNGTECVTCQTGFTLAVARTSCFLDCTIVTNCLTCNYSTQIDCLTCNAGYPLSGAICQSICGDGLRVPSQNCDDGNANTTDGCSLCTVQSGFFCTDVVSTGQTLPRSQCTACIANCIACTNSTECVTCQSGYAYLSAPPSFSCIISAIVCGDGIIDASEGCDDANTVNSDGCSSSCTVQSYYVCTPNASGVSVCSLSSILIDFVSLNKVETANSFILTYQLSPPAKAFNSLDWNTIVQQQSTTNSKITGSSFDPATGQLQVTMDYQTNLNDQTLQLSFSFPATSPFNLLPATTKTTTLSTSNNLSLQVYSQEDYALAKATQYLSLVLSLLALLFFFMGFFSGKLIALEMVAVFQLTYFSLLSLENINPSFSALRLLSFSCGYSIKPMSLLEVHRRFAGIGLDYSFLNNYNLIVLLILLPPIMSGILTLINRYRYNSTHQKLTRYSQLLRGQFMLYGLFFSAYLLVVSIGITMLRMDYLKDIHIIGAAFGGLLLALFLVYSILLGRRILTFGEFVDRFRKDNCFSSLYYCWMLIQRVVVGIILTIVAINFQSAVITGLVILQIIVIAVLRPYAREGYTNGSPNLRPIINLTITAIIQIILVMQALSPSLLSSLSTYLPLVILALLLSTIPYNLYFWVQQLRSPQPSTSIKQLVTEQTNMMNSERKKIEELNSLFIKENPFLTLSSTSRNKEFDEHDDKIINPLPNVKEQLTQIKGLERSKKLLNCKISKIDEIKPPADETWTAVPEGL